MHVNMHSLWKYAVQIIWQLLAIGIFLIFFGGLLNFTVSIANGWRMPVATNTKEILLTIGNPERAGKEFRDPREYEVDTLRQPMREDMHFLILADRIAISFDFLKPAGFPPVILGALELMHIPLGVGGVVSIGDLFMWLGTSIAAFPLLFLSPHLCVLLWGRAFKKKTAHDFSKHR